MDIRHYLLQRLTAALMAPLLLVHVGLIFYAMRGGLTAAEILGRTRGSLGWAAFYGLLVLLAAVHGAIGLRGVVREWSGLAPRALDWLMWGAGLTLLGLGWRAVYAVVA